MKIEIGKKIAKLRIEKGYTQEDLAKLCAISSAAVSKWENNNSYPDITTLPILARIFNITIDELLNFEMDITQDVIDQFIKDMIMKFTTSYEEGMKFCKTLLYTYPNSELLKLKVAGAHIQVYLCLSAQQDALPFIEEFSEFAKQLCKELVHSQDLTIRQAACILYSNFSQTTEDRKECLSYIEKLPKLMNTTTISSSLYMGLQEHDKAKHMLQTQLYQDVSNMLLYLLNLSTIAQAANQKEEAYALLQCMEQINELMNLHSTIIPQLCFSYAALQNEEQTLRLLRNYIDQTCSLKDLPNQIIHALHDTPWFSTITLKENTMPTQPLQNNIVEMIQNAPQFDFLRNHDEFQDILHELSTFALDENPTSK